MERKTVINLNVPSGLVGFAFIGLKLFGYIDWSWWWVTLPLWLPWAILGAIVAIPAAIIALAGVAFGVATFASWLNNYLRRKFQ